MKLVLGEGEAREKLPLWGGRKKDAQVSTGKRVRKRHGAFFGPTMERANRNQERNGDQKPVLENAFGFWGKKKEGEWKEIAGARGNTPRGEGRKKKSRKTNWPFRGGGEGPDTFTT